MTNTRRFSFSFFLQTVMAVGGYLVIIIQSYMTVIDEQYPIHARPTADKFDEWIDESNVSALSSFLRAHDELIRTRTHHAHRTVFTVDACNSTRSAIAKTKPTFSAKIYLIFINFRLLLLLLLCTRILFMFSFLNSVRETKTIDTYDGRNNKGERFVCGETNDIKQYSNRVYGSGERRITKNAKLIAFRDVRTPAPRERIRMQSNVHRQAPESLHSGRNTRRALNNAVRFDSVATSPRLRQSAGNNNTIIYGPSRRTRPTRPPRLDVGDCFFFNFYFSES